MDKTEKLIDWRENERVDRNRDGIDDRIEPPVPDISAGSQKLAERLRENPNADPRLSGGDIDAQWDMAESQGDEAAAGSQTTPEQNDTEETAAAMFERDATRTGVGELFVVPFPSWPSELAPQHFTQPPVVTAQA